MSANLVYYLFSVYECNLVEVTGTESGNVSMQTTEESGLLSVPVSFFFKQFLSSYVK